MGRMVSSRFMLRVVLAVLLVLGQQGATLHELSHRFEDLSAQGDKGTPHTDLCEKCVAFAGFAAALGSAPIVATLLSSPPDLPRSWSPTQHSAENPQPYLSRAPPAVS